MDVIGQHEALDDYRIVCAPEMYVQENGAAERLQAFANKGGTVILTTRSGAKDEHNNACMSQLPGIYARLAGVHAVEYVPMGWESVPLRFEDGREFEAKQWCDILETTTAEVLACYDGDYFSGAAAVTRNAFGSGTVYYIGVVGKQALYDHMARTTAKNAGLPVVENLPSRVEMVTRTGENASMRFIFNNDDKQKAFTLEGEEIVLAPFEMKIIPC